MTCEKCGHPADRHWAMGAHLCSVAQGSNSKRDRGEKPCNCSGLGRAVGDRLVAKSIVGAVATSITDNYGNEWVNEQ